MKLSQVLSSVKVYCVGAIAALVIKALYLSVRWTKVQAPNAFQAAHAGAVIAFWHGRIIMMPCLYNAARKAVADGAYMLISQHGDGRIIATAVRLLGIRSVAGSSSRGGRRALLELIRKGKAGFDIGFTPDGPRGPRGECKDGVVLAAQATGQPIYPMSYSADRTWQLRSWDGMIIPKPFSRGVWIIGEPIIVGENDDREAARIRIQDALHEITKQADTYWTAA
jgi:lysophospholipid acyltransferase (LPLAT)-like uncharacterized protein